MESYELHVHHDPKAAPEVITVTVPNHTSARSRAGRKARYAKAPVDLFRAGTGDSADRYVTTANPSDAHSAGYSFEKITS